MRTTILALAITLLGCGKDRPLTLESEPATAPSAVKWRRATVSMIFEEGRGSYTTRVRYWLKLSGPAGDHASTLDELFLEGGIAGPKVVTAGEIETLKKTKPRVQMAADGHALVYSRDGGKLYRYVALDTGDRPLPCAHLAFAPDASGDPLRAAPTTRDLALSVLRTKGTNGETHYPSSDGAWSSAFEREALGAIDHACAHQDDAELRAALSSAAKRWAPFATSVVIDRLASCAAGP